MPRQSNIPFQGLILTLHAENRLLSRSIPDEYRFFPFVKIIFYKYAYVLSNTKQVVCAGKYFLHDGNFYLNAKSRFYSAHL